MFQYRPCYRASEHAETDRRPTADEFRAALAAADRVGLTRLDDRAPARFLAGWM